MSDSNQARNPLTDDVTGGVRTMHSYDRRRDWSVADVVAVTRMHWHEGPPPYCPGCDAVFIFPYGQESLPPVLGYIHTPGCPWLTARARQVRIRCIGLAGTTRSPDGRPDAPAGQYLVSYYPEGNDGLGDSEWSPDPARAQVFESAAAAVEVYQATPRRRPLRPDGKPNRPLTALNIETEPVTP